MTDDSATGSVPAKRLSILGLIGSLGRLARPYWRRGILVGIGLLCEMAFTSALPFSFKFIIDDGLIGGDHDLLVTILVLLAIGGLLA